MAEKQQSKLKCVIRKDSGRVLQLPKEDAVKLVETDLYAYTSKARYKAFLKDEAFRLDIATTNQDQK